MASRKNRDAARENPHAGKFDPFAVTFNVLGYLEEGEWVALALEMDLRGYGETFEAALEELQDLVAMQIGFAQFKDQPELLWKSAEPVWFQLYADVRRQYLEAVMHESELPTSPYQISGLQLPPDHLLASLRSSFAPTEG
jgi:hypothetical protein